MTRGSAPMMSYPTLAEGIAQGRHLLIKCTRQDFGYDLRAWHDHIAEAKSDVPHSRSKPGVYPTSILESLENPDWIEAVRIAESTSVLDKIQSDERKQWRATDEAERFWGGRDRECPKCNRTFRSVRDRGQCPDCRYVFFASHPDGAADWWRELDEEKAEPADALESPIQSKVKS